jgi:CubicO group peptidase (beta-lactamase class C family)
VKIGDAFGQRIAQPLHMQDFEAGDVYYVGGPISVHSAYFVEITARDLARFGLMYLRHGRWRDKQIVPAAWVARSSHADKMAQSNGHDEGGYEFLWWVDYHGVGFPGISVPGMYSARGAGGHYLVIIPSADLVIVHRVDNEPPSHDTKTVTATSNRTIVSGAQFGHLLKLILDAQRQ